MKALRFLSALALRFALPFGVLGLPAGAALAQPTQISVEIDYMVDTDHSHQPNWSEISAVIQMFACQGITLTVIVDDAIPHRDVLRRDPGNNNNFFGYNNGDDTFGGIKAANFNQGSGWHYAVFGHQYQDEDYNTSGSSGMGEQPGDDFIVTLGSFSGQTGTAWDRAGTFAHELGHNLGLDHAGSMDPDVVGTDVPNVPSIMTYFTQLLGVRTALQCNGVISDTDSETLFNELDFSHGRACPLFENALSEDQGMGIIEVDWNCDGTVGGTVGQDVGEQGGGWCGSTADHDFLLDYDEWSNLVDATAMPEGSYVSKEVSCVTSDEIAAYRAVLEPRTEGGCPQPTPMGASCLSAQMHYLGPSVFPATGSCFQPFTTLTEVQSMMNVNDILYVQPGTYPASGVVLSEGPIQILGPGGAVLGGN